MPTGSEPLRDAPGQALCDEQTQDAGPTATDGGTTRVGAWLWRLPPAVRWLVGLGLLVIVNLATRLTGLRDWMVGLGWVLAVPVLALGVACLVIGLGPRRWLERDLRRGQQDPLFGGSMLVRAPRAVQRAFFIVAGGGITALGLAGVLSIF